MAPKAKKKGTVRKLRLKKATVRDLKAPARRASRVKGGGSGSLSVVQANSLSVLREQSGRSSMAGRSSVPGGQSFTKG